MADVPVVIVECSFLAKEHMARATDERRKHTHWSELEPIVRARPKTTFVLIHFSLCYKVADIRRFFAALDPPLSNIVVWV